MTRSLYPLILLLLPLLHACGQDSNAKNVATINYQQVQSYVLKRTDHYEIERRFAGNVTARQHADIGFELAGKIQQISSDEGDSVEAGDMLAALDTTLLQRERQQLNAQISETAARLKLTRSSLKRHRSLEDKGFSSQQRIDELLADQSALSASQRRLRAALAAVDNRIEKSTLKAPFSGVISRRYADAGTVMNAGSPVLRIQQRGLQEVHIGVPARLSVDLRTGQHYPVGIAGRRFDARLLTIGSDLDAVTRTVQLRLALPDDAIAPSGELAYLYLKEAIAAEGFWVPATAVTDGIRGMWAIYSLAYDEDHEGLVRVESNNVRILHGEADRYFIAAELDDGAQIAANGLHRLVPKQLVELLSDEVR